MQAGTGTIVAGDCVQFPGDNTYYQVTVGIAAGAGTITITPGLVVAIPAQATTCNLRGNVVEYDEAAGEYGDDTATAITVNGTLKATRTANTSLTVVGTIVTAGTIVAMIDHGNDLFTDNITNGTYTSTLILNKSAAMANYKYGLSISDQSNFFASGKPRQVNSVTTSSVGVGGTTVDVADITGWAVNDWIVLATTDGTWNHFDRKQIVTVTPGVGTAGTITFAATTYAHASGCPIGHLTSNVTIKSYNTTNPAFIFFRNTSTASDNRRSLKYCAFEWCGSDNSNSAKYFVTGTMAAVTTPFRSFDTVSFYNTGANQGMFLNAQNFGSTWAFNNLAFFCDSGTNSAIYYLASGCVANITNSVFYAANGALVNSAFSQGGQGATVTNCKLWASSNNCISHTNGDQWLFTGCKFHSAGTSYAQMGAGTVRFLNCNFGDSTLPGTPTVPRIFITSTTPGQAFSGLSTDCTFGTPTIEFYLTSGTSNIKTANQYYKMVIANKNVDPSQQESYYPGGIIYRDNTSKITGVTSLKMSPFNASIALTFSMFIPAPTGKKVGVSGYLWRDTSNVATVTLSGLGITPSVYTASGALSANEQFFVSGTQTTGTDGFLTLTISVTGASGNMWVDSISAPQSTAIDFGEFGYWANGLPADIITASYVSAGDVWNFLQANATVSGSMGTEMNNLPLIPALL
jgi:hypothetical protein